MVEIITSPPTIFHLAAHFEMISPEMNQLLLQVGYAAGQIQQALQQPGSKFCRTFAMEFKAIQEQLVHAQIKEEISDNGNIIRVATFSQKKYPDGIGTAGVIAIQALNKAQQSQLKKVSNRGALLWQLSVESLPTTNTLSLITRKENDVEILVTCYTGEPGLPIPNDSMPAAFYALCKKYWEEHVFLVSGKLIN